MKIGVPGDRSSLLGWGTALLAGGLVLALLPAYVTPGFACSVGDEISCFPNTQPIPSPFHAVGLVSVAVALFLLLVGILRKPTF